jgi:copper chaperone NosL
VNTSVDPENALRRGIGRRRRRRGARALELAVGALLAGACAGGPPPPAALDTAHTSCAHCRMLVSDVHFAAQIVAPGEEPVFFDDIGCLRQYLAARPTTPPRAIAYVADHRTGEWIAAAEALYSKVDSLATPMNSGLVAHKDRASRDRDEAARGGRVLGPEEVFGPAGPPRGR